jgi:membrane associated rhomboid family serine protease
MLSVFLLISLVILSFLLVIFLPIGNDNSTVRRIPWVTFSIMAINVVVFFVTFPMVAVQVGDIEKAGLNLQRFVQTHPELIGDPGVRSRLTGIGVLSQAEAEEIENQLKQNASLRTDYDIWLRSSEADQLRAQLEELVVSFSNATASSIWYQWGLAPNGNWKLHQLVTSAFLHADIWHLFGNLLFFFAVAFSLEELWGRGLFLGFYLSGAAVASLPYIINPATVPCLGASGAIAACMGAFLIRLPRAKIKLVFVPTRLLGVLSAKRKEFLIPGYIYLTVYFAFQLMAWYYDRLAGGRSGVAYSVHVAGFIYGALFASAMKLTNAEEKYIDPKIEAKVSFSAAQPVKVALDLLDNNDIALAEQKLTTYLLKNPDDTSALLALTQVYQRTQNFARLNTTYARIIHIHLANNDKEAALYAYDALLSSFPDHNVAPRVALRDWMVVCEYLVESDMKKEAAVEYERLLAAYPGEPGSIRAAVQGGEVALQTGQIERALKLFEAGKTLSPSPALAARMMTGIERCQKILDNRPNWVKSPPKNAFEREEETEAPAS